MPPAGNQLLLVLLWLTATACHPDTQPESSPIAITTEVQADSVVKTIAATVASLPPPINATQADPELESFIKRAISYSQKRQLQHLVALADDSIAISYGGDIYGKQEFKNYLLDSQWNGYTQIREALEMGGTLDSAQKKSWYCFPYCNSNLLWRRALPTLELDPYETFIGLRPQVELHEQPDKQSRIIASLPYPVLFLDEDHLGDSVKKGWLSLKTPDGRLRGSVEEKAIYSAAGMTVLIERKHGTYKITSIAPFD